MARGRRAAFALSTFGALGVAALPSTNAVAAPQGSSPTGQVPNPGTAVSLPPRIWSIERVAKPKENPSFTGPLSYSIEIRAGNDKPLDTTLRVRHGYPVLGVHPGTTTLASIPVTAPAGGSVKVVFDDAEGLLFACSHTWLFFDLVGVSGTTKLLGVKPNCAFTTATEDPTAAVPPDTKQSQRAHHAYYVAPTLATPFTCSVYEGSFKVTASIKNDTTKTANLKLVLRGPGAVVDSGTDTLAPGATSPAPLALYYSGQGLPGKYVLSIPDPRSMVGGALYQPGWNVTIGRTCNPTLSLESSNE